MKALPIVLTLAVALCGCEKKQAPPSPPKAATPPGAPSVVVVPPVDTPPPKPRPRLAPDGVVYLTKRISVTTESSVIGIPEGSKVIVLSRDSGRITGHVDGVVIETAESNTSNDLDLISAILAKRAEAEAVAASQVDPLVAAGINLPPPKPPTPQERKAARLASLTRIQVLQTNIEDAQKQLAEIDALKIEVIRKSLGNGKDKHGGQAKTKEPIQVLDPSVSDKIQALQQSIEAWQKEIVEIQRTLGL